MGDLKFDTKLSLVGAVLGTILAAAVAKVIEFFRFCVDYNRAEKVQFEDDEYYYYVKAIPKMTVAAQSKTVKKINMQRKSVTINSSVMDEERLEDIMEDVLEEDMEPEEYSEGQPYAEDEMYPEDQEEYADGQEYAEEDNYTEETYTEDEPYAENERGRSRKGRK